MKRLELLTKTGFAATLQLVLLKSGYLPIRVHLGDRQNILNISVYFALRQAAIGHIALVKS